MLRIILMLMLIVIVMLMVILIVIMMVIMIVMLMVTVMLIIVSNREIEGCLEPKGNGVNLGRGNGGGPGPPSWEQDKQLITSRGGDNSLMEQQGGREEESGVTKRTHCAQST